MEEANKNSSQTYNSRIVLCNREVQYFRSDLFLQQPGLIKQQPLSESPGRVGGRRHSPLGLSRGGRLHDGRGLLLLILELVFTILVDPSLYIPSLFLLLDIRARLETLAQLLPVELPGGAHYGADLQEVPGMKDSGGQGVTIGSEVMANDHSKIDNEAKTYNIAL